MGTAAERLSTMRPYRGNELPAEPRPRPLPFLDFGFAVFPNATYKTMHLPGADVIAPALVSGIDEKIIYRVQLLEHPRIITPRKMLVYELCKQRFGSTSLHKLAVAPKYLESNIPHLQRPPRFLCPQPLTPSSPHEGLCGRKPRKSDHAQRRCASAHPRFPVHQDRVGRQREETLPRLVADRHQPALSYPKALAAPDLPDIINRVFSRQGGTRAG